MKRFNGYFLYLISSFFTFSSNAYGQMIENACAGPPYSSEPTFAANVVATITIPWVFSCFFLLVLTGGILFYIKKNGLKIKISKVGFFLLIGLGLFAEYLYFFIFVNHVRAVDDFLFKFIPFWFCMFAVVLYWFGIRLKPKAFWVFSLGKTKKSKRIFGVLFWIILISLLIFIMYCIAMIYFDTCKNCLT